MSVAYRFAVERFATQQTRSHPDVWAIYARLSETDDELPLEDQIQWALMEAERMGVVVAPEHVFKDNDISASRFSTKPRQGFDDLQCALSSGEVNAVICVEQNRLLRRAKFWFAFKELNPRLKIHTQELVVDLVTGQGVEAADLAAVKDEHESERISRRVSRRKQAQARKGEPPKGGARRFGYTRTYDIFEDEADVLRTVVAKLLDGDSLTSAIQGTGLSRIRAKRILTSPTIAGYRNHPRVGMVKGQWNGILTKPEWERLQRALAKRSFRAATANTYLLSGLVYCGRCQRKCHSNGGGNARRAYRKYVCKANHGSDACYGTARTAEGVEAVVTAAVLNLLESGALAQAVNAIDDRDERADTLYTEVTRLQAKANDATDDYKADLIDRAHYLEIIADCRTKIQRAQVELSTLEGGYALSVVTAENIRATWDAASLDWKRALLGDVISQVVLLPIDRQGRGRGSFNPSLVDIRWKL